MMLYTRKQMEREIDRRMHEESMWREVWERLDRQQKQIEELRFTVERMKHENDWLKQEATND